MKNTWVVVANSTLARIFSVENNRDLKELELLEHPEGRLHTRDLVSDKPGRGFESSSANPARHAKEQQTSPKKQEFNIFARHLSEHLDRAHNQGRFERLYIAANPSFLGILRQALSHNISQSLVGELDKDMTQLMPNEIRQHLPFVI